MTTTHITEPTTMAAQEQSSPARAFYNRLASTLSAPSPHTNYLSLAIGYGRQAVHPALLQWSNWTAGQRLIAVCLLLPLVAGPLMTLAFFAPVIVLAGAGVYVAVFGVQVGQEHYKAAVKEHFGVEGVEVEVFKKQAEELKQRAEGTHLVQMTMHYGSVAIGQVLLFVMVLLDYIIAGLVRASQLATEQRENLAGYKQKMDTDSITINGKKAVNRPGMSVTVVLISGDFQIYTAVSDVFLTAGTYTKLANHITTLTDLLSLLPTILTGDRPACIGHPSHWPRATINQLYKACQGIQVVLVPSCLLAAYGCAKPSALVLELLDGDRVGCGVVVDGQVVSQACLGALPVDSLIASIETVLHNVDPEKKSTLLDNLIMTGPAWSPSMEHHLIKQVESMSTVSKFAGDLQPRSITCRHCPEYHVELLKLVPREQLQPVIGLFGGAISCRALLTESSRQ